MKRSVVKFKDINISRLEKIVKEAAEQSQRLKLMDLSEVISFKQLLSKLQNYDLILFAHVGNKDQVNLFNELKDFNNKKILVIVGPEGGFDDKEVEVLESYNHLKTVSLGKRILRTETAPLFVMSVLGFLGEQYEN
jgi:16S rRNA (uracil1498-N3)-methyltransferase